MVRRTPSPASTARDPLEAVTADDDDDSAASRADAAMPQRGGTREDEDVLGVEGERGRLHT